MPAGAKAPHPPDLGAVRNGELYAIELERAVKTVDDYEAVIAAYIDAERNQVWHIWRQPTVRKIMMACEKLGVQWLTGVGGGVMVSTDGKVRLQGWTPGRSGLSQPSTWKSALPTVAPAAFTRPEVMPDLTQTWRVGRVLDLDGPLSNAGMVM